MESCQQTLANKRYVDAQNALVILNPVDVVGLLRILADKEQSLAFRLLPKDEAVAVFQQMESKKQGHLLETYQAGAAAERFQELSPDDQVRLLDEVPAMVAWCLIQALNPADREQTLEILCYAEGTAGLSMTPDYVELRRDMTIAQALERIRRQALKKETIYVAYVIDEQPRLVGVLSLRDLVVAQPEGLAGNNMTTDVKFTCTSTDRGRGCANAQRL